MRTWCWQAAGVGFNAYRIGTATLVAIAIATVSIGSTV